MSKSETLPAKTSRTVELRTADGKTVEVPIDDLRNLSVADLASYPTVQASEAIGTDQFGPILQNKSELVGKPFVVVHWEFHKSEEYGGEFVSLWVLTNDDAKYIVNDGSTGICDQLRELTDDQGVDSMLVCPHGFRRSDYEKTLPDGKTIQASTFYLDTSL